MRFLPFQILVCRTFFIRPCLLRNSCRDGATRGQPVKWNKSFIYLLRFDVRSNFGWDLMST